MKNRAPSYFFGLLIGGILGFILAILISYFSYKSLSNNNLRDFLALIIGVLCAIGITFWAYKKDWVGEKYCIALLFFIGFVVWGIVDYDLDKGHCEHAAPMYHYSTPSKAQE